MRFLAKVCTGRRPPPNSAAWAFLLAALFGLFASASFGQGYWGTPIVLTASNPSVIETATQPRVIFANAGAGPATGTLTWSGTGDSWEWDGTQWHYRGTAGSMSGTGWLILGLVPRGATMPFTATFTPPCVPTTCSLAGATCGNVPDGCGGSLNCGGCPAGQICGGGGIPNVCGGGGGGCIPGAWSLTAVETSGDTGRYPATKTDASGGVHIAYYDVTTHELKYAHRPPGGAWTYYAFTGGGVLLYAYRTPGTPPTGGIWTIQNADSTVGVGQFNSLALDPADDPHIAYRDLSNHDLRYVFRTPLGVWAAPEVVDSVGQVANYGITLDMAGSVAHVAYYDWTNGDLKYGSRCP